VKIFKKIIKSRRSNNISNEKNEKADKSETCLFKDEENSFLRLNELSLEVFNDIVETLVTMNINIKQLSYLPKIVENNGLKYYKLIDKLSSEQGTPKSTVRWNIKKLRDAGLITAGDRENKGVPVNLTEKGRVLLVAAQNLLSKNSCSKPLFKRTQSFVGG
jgi:DNA-binding MarR family transcriptional regulator